MKKFTLLILFFFIIISISLATSKEQGNYRWRNDDGSQATLPGKLLKRTQYCY